MPSSPSSPVGRRTVIASAGGLGVAAAAVGVVAACGPSSTPTAPSASGGAGAGLTTASGEIPVGSGKIFPEQSIVVTQPQAGEFKAFSAVCTHRQCLVTKVEAGKILCPCHGSQFDISTGAPTPDSEAKRPLPPRTATVTGGTVTVS